MSVTAIALLTITDQAKLSAYREKAGDALARHGGRVTGAGPISRVLEAAGDPPNMVAILEFPSAEAAQAWRDDPELAEVHALRNAAGASTVFIAP